MKLFSMLLAHRVRQDPISHTECEVCMLKCKISTKVLHCMSTSTPVYGMLMVQTDCCSDELIIVTTNISCVTQPSR
jgi:hypothetical protein